MLKHQLSSYFGVHEYLFTLPNSLVFLQETSSQYCIYKTNTVLYTSNPSQQTLQLLLCEEGTDLPDVFSCIIISNIQLRLK